MSQPTPDLNAELDAARKAVGRRNCAAAIAHLVNVVPHAPANPAVTAVLDDLVAAAPDPRQLVPSGPASYGAAAVHAYALGKARQAAEAYQVLRQLVPANPGNGIIDWALPWLEAGALTAAQRAEAVSLFFASAQHRGFGNRPRLEPHEADLVRRWLPHVEAVLKGRPLDDPVYSMFVPLLRKTGRQEEAMRIVRARHAAAPSYESAVSLAATLRDGRDFAGWFTASQECLKFRPDDVATRLDLGDCFWEDQGKLEDAERWYADALRLQPDEPWAAPSLLPVRRLRTDETRWRDELEAYARAHPDNGRARVVLGRITPFFADFFHPADATVNLMTGWPTRSRRRSPKAGLPAARAAPST
jgi:tetratricopeptide (TPR) repeat protein